MGFITTSTSNAKGLGALRQFSFPFWLVNILEFFERGAFYALAPILTAFMMDIHDLSATQAGVIAAIQFALLFFLPVVTAAIADKMGFRAALAASFALLGAGYASLLFLNGFWGILAAVFIYGTGAGLFKPIIAAVVAQTTKPEQRNFGYAIYYWLINFGAFLIPGLLAVYFGVAGVATDVATQARIILIANAVLMTASLVATLLLYRNLRPPQPEKSVGQALRDIAPAFKDARFLTLLVIYSGFWFMYAMNQTFLPVYVQNYFVNTGLAPSWFSLAALGTINPGTIILLGPVVGKLAEKTPSLLAIILGVSIYVVGFSALSFTALFWVVAAAVVFYSIGEFLVHPNFLSYTSRLAPSEHISIYMGVAFVPIGLGYITGSLAGGVLYDLIVQSVITPSTFWAIISSVGLLTIGALLLYNRWMERRDQVIPKPTPSRARGWLTGPASAALAILLIPGLVTGAMIGGTSPEPIYLDENAAPALVFTDVQKTLDEATTAEGDAVGVTFALPEHAQNGTLTLTWTDEAANAGLTNRPDTLRLSIAGPDGTVLDEVEGDGGELAITLPGNLTAGDYAATVTVVDAGDVYADPLPAAVEEDTESTWRLDVAYAHGTDAEPETEAGDTGNPAAAYAAKRPSFGATLPVA